MENTYSETLVWCFERYTVRHSYNEMSLPGRQRGAVARPREHTRAKVAITYLKLIHSDSHLLVFWGHLLVLFFQSADVEMTMWSTCWCQLAPPGLTWLKAALALSLQTYFKIHSSLLQFCFGFLTSKRKYLIPNVDTGIQVIPPYLSDTNSLA